MKLIDADALRESIITRQTEMSYEDAWALTERTKERKLMEDSLAYDSTKAMHMGMSYGQWMAMKEGRC